MTDKIEDTIEKSEDKKDIEMEEREQMLNAENKATQGNHEAEAGGDEKKNKSDSKEGMEVKPKKIPVGGIQMPGFFTRSKSKEKCKDEDQEGQEGTELIENKITKEETPQNSTTNRLKLSNPFKKSKTNNEEEESKEKNKLFDSIRIPFVSVLSRKKNLENQTQQQAGLASMETLDDKSTDDKNNDEMKNIPLNDNKDKIDLEKQEAQSDEPTWRQFIKQYKVAISAFLIFLLLLIIIIAIAVPGSEIPRSAPIKDGKYVETVTSCGKVEGLLEDNAVAFRGIPYARPPTGDFRFKRAHPLNKIEYCWNGTFLAHNATDTCLQIHSNGTVSGVEDCLTLDVVTPYVRYDNPLPVIVLIGADSLVGGSPGKMRPSARYARSRDVVFVRPNFRLGALGFLALETLSNSNYPRSSGNYGLSDILEALKWVQLNIEHFGGDKKSVTLFGHKAGAALVTALTTIDKPEKYFARAWASSGGAIYPKKSLEEAEIDNKSYLNIVDCQDVECLRKLDAEKLTRSIEDVWRKPTTELPTKMEQPEKRHEWLVLDGMILKEAPSTVWSREEELPVKLVLGTTAHSGASEKLLLKHKEWTEELVKQYVNESALSSKNLTEEALKLYPATYKGLVTMISDLRIVCPLLNVKSKMQKVPFYVVTEPRGNDTLADIDSDIDAILGRYEPKTPEQRRYFSAMQSLFYHYVWHGKVEQNFDQKVLIVGQDISMNVTYSHCGFWNQHNMTLSYAALD